MQAGSVMGRKLLGCAGGRAVTKPLPFTAAGIARAIKGVQAAGKHVIGDAGPARFVTGSAPAPWLYVLVCRSDQHRRHVPS